MDSRSDSGFLNVLIQMGEALQNSGAEIYRVEDTLNRIGYAYGAEEMNVFVITSSIIITMKMPGKEPLTQTRRLKKSGGNDFVKLEELNELSRRICSGRIAVDEFEQQLDQLQQDVMLLENALLIFIDIANLKTINDTYGMQIGDEAVIRTARSIQAAESDACEQHTECFRIAGDEFAIVVTRPQKRPEEWEQMIRNEMKKESGSRYPVQLEFGCSYLRKADGTLLSISDWKMQADQMLLFNKEKESEDKYELL